jgi:hypothetical protein
MIFKSNEGIPTRAERRQAGLGKQKTIPLIENEVYREYRQNIQAKEVLNQQLELLGLIGVTSPLDYQQLRELDYDYARTSNNKLTCEARINLYGQALGAMALARQTDVGSYLMDLELRYGDSIVIEDIRGQNSGSQPPNPR